MRFGVSSDKGKVRSINEDSCNVIAGYPGIPTIFVVADGMGGHNSGEIASSLAVEYVSEAIMHFSEMFPEGTNIQALLSDIIAGANNYVYEKSMAFPDYLGMGTTIIVAAVWENRLYIGHVGDSRLYRLSDGGMEQMTTDHSLVEELVQSGSLTREEAENHPKKNVITRALGCAPDIEIDSLVCDLKPGDKYLICTDGLTNKLSEKEIRTIVEKAADHQSACDRLVKKANDKGGEDNITAIVFEEV